MKNRSNRLLPRGGAALLALAFGVAPLVVRGQAVDLDMTDRIVDEGQRHGEVMEIARYLSD
ncbi:hypothetical protein GY652_27925, partial [Escherichia coli]|nr:hypothetical protein [Escherichia coli]